MIQGRKVGRPKKLSEQKRTERVVTVLTPEEKQWLKYDIGEQSMSEALRQAINIIHKLGQKVKTEREIYRLDDLEPFILKIGGALRGKDIEVTIKSKGSVIKVKDGHIFFQSPKSPIDKAVISQELKELEQRFRNLIESPPIGAFILQGDRFKYVAPRIMDVTGYDNERFLNEPVFDLVYPDDRETIEEMVQKGLRGEEIPTQVSFRALAEDGEVIYVNSSVMLIEYEGYPAIAGSFADVTELRELKHDLEELRRIVQEWLRSGV